MPSKSISVDFHITPPAGWDAIQRRDFIEGVLENLSIKSPEILMSVMKGIPCSSTARTQLLTQVFNTPLEDITSAPLLRTSFPWSGYADIVVKMNAIIPENYLKVLVDQQTTERHQIENGKVMRASKWLLLKLLNPEARKDFDKTFEAKRLADDEDQARYAWSSQLFSSTLSTMGEWLTKKGFSIFDVHIQVSGSATTVIHLSELLHTAPNVAISFETSNKTPSAKL